MGLFSRRKSEDREKTLVQLRTNVYKIQPGEDLSCLKFSGIYTADDEPVYTWQVPNRVDKKLFLEREK